VKSQLIAIVAAVLVVGCGESQQSAPAPETKPVEPVAEAATPEPPTVKAPDISIHEAAGTGNIEAVKQHLAAGTDVNAKDWFENTPLHRAALEGRKEIAELLIANGAEVNAKGALGNTPLYSAANKEIAELLIANGAEVNAKDYQGGTPLDRAEEAEHTEIANLLHKNGGKHGTIHGAAVGGDIKAVKEFLAAGTDVNTEDKCCGETPLHHATAFGRKEMSEQLIGAGADVNAQSTIGVTALYISAVKGHKEIAELLIAEGSDVNVMDNEGKTPLDCAEDEETAALLRKHGGKTGEELKAKAK